MEGLKRNEDSHAKHKQKQIDGPNFLEATVIARAAGAICSALAKLDETLTEARQGEMGVAPSL